MAQLGDIECASCVQPESVWSKIITVHICLLVHGNPECILHVKQFLSNMSIHDCHVILDTPLLMEFNSMNFKLYSARLWE